MSKPIHQVALALVRRNHQWLVAKRRPDVHLGGLWEFPGGKCALEESPAEAALRELLEESGIVATPVQVLETVECEYDDRIVHLTPVLCQWAAGEPRALDSDACVWVDSAELRRLDMPAVNAGIVHRALAACSEAEPPAQAEG